MAKEDKMWNVYMHISPSGKRYIGITSQIPKRRWKKDGTGYIHNPHFWNAIQKYGWDNFQHIIVLENETYERACAAEMYLIKHYRTKNPKYGYNMTDGGDGSFGWIPSENVRKKIGEKNRGRKHSEDTKRKISAAMRGENNPSYGKHCSDEKKEKLRIKRKELYSDPRNHHMYGKHHSEETKKKIGEKVKERLSNPENHPNYGKHINMGITHGRIKPIYCIEMSRIFWGASEAHQEYGFNISCISECLRGKRQYTGKHPVTEEKLHWLCAEDAIEQKYITREELNNYLHNIKNK